MVPDEVTVLIPRKRGELEVRMILRLALRAVHYLNRVQIRLMCVGRQVC